VEDLEEALARKQVPRLGARKLEMQPTGCPLYVDTLKSEDPTEVENNLWLGRIGYLGRFWMVETSLTHRADSDNLPRRRLHQLVPLLEVPRPLYIASSRHVA
jgi:hypothetical protein